MRSLAKLLLVLAVILAGALLLALDRQPSIDRVAEITPESIGRAKRILDVDHPRLPGTGPQRNVSVNRADLDLAANYLAQQYARGSAQVDLTGGAARVVASVPLPAAPMQLFVNVDAVLTAATPMPKVQRLQLGRLALPGFAADWLLKHAIIHLIGEDAFNAAASAVKNVEIADGRVQVTYEWHAYLKDKVHSALLPSEDRQRLEIYQRRLSEVTRSLSGKNVSLPELLSPLFALAQERSRNEDPLAENRAAILVLTFYVDHKELHAFLPAAKQWPQPAARAVTLNGRDDFSKHFMTSAALAAKAGGPLADAVGIYKEVTDSRGGSGFSFGDIAADRAGTRFGQKAVENVDSARRLQRQIAAGIVDGDIAPATEDLPESMSEREFKQRFGGVDGSGYKQMMGDIEHRIAMLTLYR